MGIHRRRRRRPQKYPTQMQYLNTLNQPERHSAAASLSVSSNAAHRNRICLLHVCADNQTTLSDLGMKEYKSHYAISLFP